ncbi:MAG TPA: YetF domain-containing protein [Gaiellaceae bacterium]
MDLVLRAIFLYFFVFAITRAIGRRELSQLAPFDIILLIVAGDAIQQGLTQDDYSLTGAVLVVGTFAVLTLITSYASFRFARLRPILEGEPIVIMQNGTFLDGNLSRERLTQGEVAEEARQQQIASLDEVEWAVLENSGKISFIRKGS